MFRWVTRLSEKVYQVQGEPSDHGDGSDLHYEYEVHEAGVEVLFEQDDAHEVDCTRGYLD
jgi:hypothetical protein